MKKFHEIEKANSDEDELFGLPSKRGELIAKLNSDGKHPIFVGRSLIVIEQCEENDPVPAEIKCSNPLQISIYSDPDVYDMEEPHYLFIEASKYGMPDVYWQIVNSENKVRIFKMEEKLIRDEF